MSDRIRCRVRFVSFGLALCSLVASASAQKSKFEHLARPKFTDLVTIDGISEGGSRVVATFEGDSDGIDRPVVWDATGTAMFLERLPEPGYSGTYTYPGVYRQTISADGSLIGGYCQSYADPSGFFGSPPVTWDATGAIRQLPSPFVGSGVSYEGFVSAVSPNGAYLYGWCQIPENGANMPFRWNAAGQATMLQSLSDPQSRAFPVISATSADGTIAVGKDYAPVAPDSSGDERPVRWKPDGSVEALRILGTDPDGHTQGSAFLCSADGSIVVGKIQRYSSAGAFLDAPYVCWLGDGRIVKLPGEPFAMTPDGKTIVGDDRYDLIDGKIVATSLGRPEFGAIYAADVSDDGRVIVGYGSPSTPIPGALVWIHNRAYSLADLLAHHGVRLPVGWTSLDGIAFCSADGTVFVGYGTFGTERTAFRATIPDILVDKEAPVFGSLPPVRAFCDPGKIFATPKLKIPEATDNFPGKVVVTTKDGPRFPIGTTYVVWTATDAAGNVVKNTQKVIVTNRKPEADAGSAVVVTTRSERGARVTLDGSGSSDPDEQALTFAWNARGVSLSRTTTAKPIGLFKVGRTTATLTVTDAGGAEDTDSVRVTVKLKNARKRALGGSANEQFAAAVRTARATGGEAANSTAASGFAFASIAAAYGDATGEFVRWEEGQSEADATFAYSELRAAQAAYGHAAANALLSAYAETGDESLLSAYRYAAYGTAYANADLTEE
jgi:hypothetical protein